MERGKSCRALFLWCRFKRGALRCFVYYNVASKIVRFRSKLEDHLCRVLNFTYMLTTFVAKGASLC